VERYKSHSIKKALKKTEGLSHTSQPFRFFILTWLCSQYGEIAASCAFFAGACVAPAPDAGYDPVRYDGIAVMSATGSCQALFAVKYLLHPSSFLRNDEANLSPRLTTIGVLPFIAIAIHYTPNPLIFYSQKIISLSTLNGNRAIIKRFGKR
jgi:hypothetical protein